MQKISDVLIGAFIRTGKYFDEIAPRLKTHTRLNKKIEFNLPSNYVQNKTLENDVSRVVNDGWSFGVWVLCAPKGTGKTTAVKKILKELQDGDGIKKIPAYDLNNKKITITKKLKPVYIDLKETKFIQNTTDWIDDQFGKINKYSHIVDTINDNTKAVIVLDHMERSVLDGFEGFSSKTFDQTIANSFFTCHATSSYNEKKHVVIVVTEDPLYANDILTKCNFGAKFHSISDPIKYINSCEHQNSPSNEDWEKFKKTINDNKIIML